MRLPGIRQFVLALLAPSFLATPSQSNAQQRGSAALAESIKGLGVSVRVLMIGAHPDDEDTNLIAWLARGRHVETAYLSLTRGDGGQNLIGNELGEALGVIRTEELLAARRIDGAKQYFTRAYDFGFSKDTVDTFSHWPREELLGDVVRVVREFAPHVIVAVFSGTARDGHGQHQVSGILAREAFDAAGDLSRFPAKEFGRAWLPGKFYRSARFAPAEATLAINVGEYNPALGKSYAEIAAESRSQHRSQGFGTLRRLGVVMDWVRREASRVGSPGDPKGEKSMFDGIDTRLARIAPAMPCKQGRDALDSIQVALDGLRIPGADQLDLLGSIARAASVAQEQHTDVVGRCAPVDPDTRKTLNVLAERTQSALVLALGVDAEATAGRASVAVGDSVAITQRLFHRGPVPVDFQWIGLKTADDRALAPDSSAVTTVNAKPSRVHQPYWLTEPRNGDMFTPRNLFEPDSVYSFASVRAQRAGVGIGNRPVYHFADPIRGDVQNPMFVAPGISVTLDRSVEVARAGASVSRVFTATVRSAYADTSRVSVSLSLPRGLSGDSLQRKLSIGPGGVRRVSFLATGALPAGTQTVRASVTARGKTFSSGYVPINYEHITPQRIYRPAAVAINAIDVELPAGLRVGYIRGVGDNVPATVADLGVHIDLLEPASLATVDLSRYATIVVGPRAYQASQDLIDNNNFLLEFARRGGTLLVQYGQYEMVRPGVMPFPVTLKRPADRVTIESAPVTITSPAVSLLNYPNKITGRDFGGWVQERSLYMPSAHDDRYRTSLAMNDPGEPSKTSAILAAPLGKGLYIYTTLSFFRQLPAGNAGATRLFVNLLSANAGNYR